MALELKLAPRQELKQVLALHQIIVFSNLLEMNNAQLFEFLKNKEGTGQTDSYPMFSLEKFMAVPRHLDVWVYGGMIREASHNYINYATSGETSRKSNRAFGSIAWMLKAREKMLELATAFILRYHHEFFWGGKRLNPINIQEAVHYINGLSEEFFLDNPVEYSIFYRVIKNKTISVEGKEYPMKFFFSRNKVHLHEFKKFVVKEIENNPKISDGMIAEEFYNKFGYPLARRTVQKYRKMLKISSSHNR
jgi:DNA-directed RNA polymerase specialized sigma54-like protein